MGRKVMLDFFKRPDSIFSQDTRLIYLENAVPSYLLHKDPHRPRFLLLLVGTCDEP